MKAKPRIKPARPKASEAVVAPDWRAKALELLPESSDDLAESESAMQYWLALHFAFEHAYLPPVDTSLIQRIYAFADWCVENSADSGEASNHLFSCVAYCFYEEIPMFAPSRADMPNWFTRQQMEDLKTIFCYHLGVDDFSRLLERFPFPESKRNRKSRER